MPQEQEFDPKLLRYYWKPKNLVLDVDGTLHPPGTKSLIFRTFDHLEENEKFRSNRQQVEVLIGKAINTANMEYLREAVQLMTECELERSLIYRACERAAREFSFLNNLHLALRILKRDMNYAIYLVSGSFSFAIDFLTQRFAGYLEVKGYGSKLHFDNSGILRGIDLMVGERKVEVCRELSPLVVVTDDPILDKKLIQASVERNSPVLLVGRKESLASSSPLVMETINVREDAMELVRHAKIFEYLSLLREKGFDYIEINRKLTGCILESDDASQVADSAMKLYRIMKEDFVVSDVLSHALSIKSGNHEHIEDLRKLIRRRVWESWLEEGWYLEQ